jgi:type VI secretion system protein ImpM
MNSMSVGFYGKLPSHGDFVSRSVPDAFLDRWDAWLQAGVAQSRTDLGEAWLDVFLTSPVWRFAFQGGVIGGSAWAGILLPSVDRVGRYFPLTIVTGLPPGADPHVVSVAAAGWFDWVEEVARRALEQDLLDLETLHGELQASERMLVADRLAEGPVAAVGSGFPQEGALWRFDTGPEADMGRFHARLTAALTGDALSPLAMWWSVGSGRVAPSVLMTRGLPPSATFQDLLRAEWSPAWRTEATADAADPNAVAGDATASPFRSPRLYDSAAVTDVGRQRSENQDAYVERGQEGFWLVADGMGGHQFGGWASQVVAECATVIDLAGDVTTMANASAQALQEANAQLRRRAATEPGFDAGTTVVALCLRDDAGIVAWAGDSRLYRLREGELTQLTRDHTVANDPGAVATGADAHVITRAVGGAPVLELDQLRFEVRDGDRFLLCSDGLYSELSAGDIAAELGAPDCAAAAKNLVARALEHGGEDNITAVVVGVTPRS